MQEGGKMGRFYVVTVDQYDYQEAIKGIGRYGRFEQCVLLNEIRPDFVEGQLRMPGNSECRVGSSHSGCSTAGTRLSRNWNGVTPSTRRKG